MNEVIKYYKLDTKKVCEVIKLVYAQKGITKLRFPPIDLLITY